MSSEKTFISNAAGMHARPAGELVKLVKSLAPCKVELKTSVKTVNAASMLSVLSLGLKQGTELEVITEGEGEKEALASVLEFIRTME